MTRIRKLATVSMATSAAEISRGVAMRLISASAGAVSSV
jgi:hypothetical protein